MDKNKDRASERMFDQLKSHYNTRGSYGKKAMNQKDFDENKVEPQEAPMRESPKKTRGITRTPARSQKAPDKSGGFLKHTIKGKC